jgi:hypothetical protein
LTPQVFDRYNSHHPSKHPPTLPAENGGFPPDGGDTNEAAQVLGLGRRLLHGYGHAHRVQTQIEKEDLFMDCDKCVKNLAVFAGGVLFGSAGLKLLSSRDAKKAYTHATAAALRMKESVMETVTTVQENAADILASAKDLNAQRAEQEASDTEET